MRGNFMDIILKKLKPDDGREIYEMLQKIPKSENGFMNAMHGAPYQEYLQWLKRCDLDSGQTGITDGWKVPGSTYWFFVDGRAAGYGKIRHFLTEKLLADGGHIGYSICPSERGRGLGKLFLRELIKECGNIGIDRALLTIHKDNTPSVKTALANGGVIEKSSDAIHYIWIDCMK